MPAVTPVLLAAALAAAADDKPKSDREALVGTWKIVEYHDDGAERMGRLVPRPLTPKDGPEKYPRLVFTADACYVLRPGKDGGVRELTAGLTNVNWKAVKLDETAKPKAIDITPHKKDPAAKDVVLPGIYELDGKKLRIAWNETPAQSKHLRPTEFKSDGHMNLFVCEKLSDTPEKPASDQVIPPPAKKP
ncbi:MAG: hypothetical protein C0501_29365 [Isosphaera sp.]|nr:hypothetical protein [Isosphaera sp.]